MRRFARTLRGSISAGSATRMRSKTSAAMTITTSQDQQTKFSPFLDACAAGNLSQMKSTFSLPALVSGRSYVCGSTALHFAVMSRSLDAVRFVVQQATGATAMQQLLDAKDRTTASTPLLLALKSDLTDIAVLLLQSGADVNAPDANQCTPLHIAVLRGNDTVLAELVARKANPLVYNLLTPPSTAVELAVQCSNVSALRHFAATGLCNLTSQSADTAMVRAIQRPDMRLFEYLVDDLKYPITHVLDKMAASGEGGVHMSHNMTLLEFACGAVRQDDAVEAVQVEIVKCLIQRAPQLVHAHVGDALPLQLLATRAGARPRWHKLVKEHFLPNQACVDWLWGGAVPPTDAQLRAKHKIRDTFGNTIRQYNWQRHRLLLIASLKEYRTPCPMAALPVEIVRLIEAFCRTPAKNNKLEPNATSL